jgi:D-serine deaminase-like pyridoxal phosphate-dependent protein
MRLTDLATPALVLDRSRLARNLAIMSARARTLGVDLRPHMKTSKSAEVARLATSGHSGGITVSTLNEAGYFLGHGIRDITYAVGVVPAKLDRVAALRAKGAALTIMTDTVEVARAIAARGAALGTRFPTLVEIDTGDRRGGVPADSAELIEVGRVLHGSAGAELRGVLAHAGHSYDCPTIADVERVAEEERAGAVGAAERLRAAGLPAPVVSVGSTPTARHARRLDGVTEMRPGVYVFGDLFQAGIGSCAIGDLAVSVLASVIGRRPADNRVLIDAGGLALSKDRSTAGHPFDAGFGLVTDLALSPIAGARVVQANQEHGHVEGRGRLPFEILPIGAKLRVLPNHVCMTAAMYDRYHVVDGDDEIVAVWDRTNGW